MIGKIHQYLFSYLKNGGLLCLRYKKAIWGKYLNSLKQHAAKAFSQTLAEQTSSSTESNSRMLCSQGSIKISVFY
jgi:hypothetical protein